MYARYIEAVILALRGHVRSTVDGRPAHIVDECVSTLAAIANALDARDAPADDPVARWLRAGPPENPGLHRDLAGPHGDLVQRIADGAAIDEPAVRTALTREQIQGRTAMDRIFGLMAHPAAAASGGKAGIDPAALERFLRDSTGSASLTVSDFRQVLGGRSRQTVIFTVSGTDALPAELVVQRQTPGMENLFAGTAVEVDVLRTLRGAGMSVPKVFFASTDPAVLGASFMIMERASGVPAQRDFWDMPAGTEHVVDIARQLAILHRHAPGKLAAILPRPRQTAQAAGWLEEVDRLSSRLLAEAHGPSVTVAVALACLRQLAHGIGDTETIVHNDFMFHNVLIADGRITAVLDWEQVALGHPGEDLGYIYPVIEAMGCWDQFLDTYVAAGGIPVSQREVDFFALRAILRLMVMVFEGRAAFESGGTDEIIVAGAGAGFLQRLHQRLADVLAEVIGRC